MCSDAFAQTVRPRVLPDAIRETCLDAARRARIVLSGVRRGDLLRRLPQGTVGAEVGVFRGGFTADILRLVRPRELHLIDGWDKLYGERFPNWGWYTRFGRLKTATALGDVRRVLRRRDPGGTARVHVGHDIEILRSFEDARFDWVYLDSAHDREHMIEVLDVVRTKVRTQGSIMGHDWRPDPAFLHHGVYEAVMAFCAKTNWRVVATDDFTQWLLCQDDARRHMGEGGDG